MLPTEIYNYLAFSTFYFWLAVLFSFSILLLALFYSNGKIIQYACMSFVLFFLVFLFLRPIFGDFAFADSGMYESRFNFAKKHNAIFENRDLAFSYLTLILSKLMNFRMYIITLSITMFLLMFNIGKRLLGKDYIIFMMLYIFCVYTFTLLTSMLRQEMALLVFFCGIVMDRKLAKYTLVLIAVLFHKSIILLVLTIIAVDFIKVNIKTLICLWLIGSALAFSTQGNYLHFFNFLSLDDRFNYIIANDPSSPYFTPKKFRWDFWLFSFSFIIFIGIAKKFMKTVDKRFDYFSKIYIVSNILWLFLMFSNHTNRFALMSWSVIPFLLSVFIINTDKQHSQLFLGGALSSFAMLNLLLFLT